ncbi:MAG: redoxin domain-containing protein [Caldisericia bacterium]
MRFLAEFMGHRVLWLNHEKSVLVRGQGRNIKIWYGEEKYESLGEKKTFDNTPVILRDRMLIDTNFISGELDLETKEIEPEDGGYHLLMEIDENRLLPHAPGFTLETQSGGMINFHEELARDDVKCILINFWSTRCLPCNQELPALVKLYNKYKDQGLLVLGVCTDSSHLDEERAELIETLGVEYPVPLDPMAETYYSWGGLGVPNMTLVNKDGLIVWQHDGYSPETPGIAETEIKKILGLED